MSRLILLALLALSACTQDYGFPIEGDGRGAPTARPEDDCWVEDTFRVGELDAVDILFVVDNSHSMEDDQSRLAAALPDLGRDLLQQDLNYRIGFTTTDWRWPKLRPLPASRGFIGWIDPETRGSDDLFIYGATPGITGSGTETGLYNAQATGHAEGFWRPGSAAYVVVLSDEPDNSHYIYTAEEPEIDGYSFADWFNNFRGSGSFSIIGIPGTQPEYEKAAYLTGGRQMDLRAADWSDMLGEWAAYIEPDPVMRFSLTHVPLEPEAIRIELCVDVDQDGSCYGRDPDHADITHVYLHGKPGWTYSYDAPSNSLVLVSSQREVQQGDRILAQYQIRP